jgi:hypothetical protein
MKTRHPRWALMGGAAALAAALAVVFSAGGAYANIGACRSDPVVTLSNGTQVTLYEDISDSASDVSSISYQLHVPTGLKVKSIAYQGAVPSNVQTITVTADENAGNYDGYTVVKTKTPNISVAAYMSANGTVSCHTSGHSGQTLHSHLHLS